LRAALFKSQAWKSIPPLRIYALEAGVEGMVMLDGRCRTRSCSNS
jgi:hypothetical protein